MATIMRARARLLRGTTPLGLSQTYWNPGTPGGSTADATDVLARFRSAWAGVAGILSSELQVQFDPECVTLNDATGEIINQFTGVAPASVLCTSSGQRLPLQTQLCVRLRTSQYIKGRRVQGRLFIPGYTELGNTSSGGPAAGDVTLLGNSFDDLIAAGTTASTLVIWRRPKTKPVELPGGNSPVTTVVGCPDYAVLRGRRDL